MASKTNETGSPLAGLPVFLMGTAGTMLRVQKRKNVRFCHAGLVGAGILEANRLFAAYSCAENCKTLWGIKCSPRFCRKILFPQRGNAFRFAFSCCFPPLRMGRDNARECFGRTGGKPAISPTAVPAANARPCTQSEEKKPRNGWFCFGAFCAAAQGAKW